MPIKTLSKYFIVLDHCSYFRYINLILYFFPVEVEYLIYVITVYIPAEFVISVLTVIK